MPFSNSAWDMPRLDSYERAEKYFNETRCPRSAAWAFNARPLYDKTSRFHHYRLEKKEWTTYAFMLYDTAVVEWYSPNSFKLDLTYASSMTFNYFPNFVPSELQYRRGNKFGSQSFTWKDTYYKVAQKFYFERRNDDWELCSSNELVDRWVVDKNKTAEVEPLLREFSKFVRGLWGVCGDKSPFEGVTINRPYWHDRREQALHFLRQEAFMDIVQAYLPADSYPNSDKYAGITANSLVCKVRKEIYKHIMAYTLLPYNQTSRRTKP